MQLRAWRKQQRLRLADLHPKFGIPLNRLSELERGRVWPKPDELFIIGEVTGGAVTTTDIMENWLASNPVAVNEYRERVARMREQGAPAG